jgi:hypothetical protein
MVLTLLNSPPAQSPVPVAYVRNLSGSIVLGAYPGEPPALAAVRQVTGKVAAERLVLTDAHGEIVAAGRLLFAWAALDRRPDGGVPRVRRDKGGNHMLCGWCGGTVARAFSDRIAPVEALMWAGTSTTRLRHGLPTLRVRSNPHRNRYRQALSGSFSAAEMDIRPDGRRPVVAVECPRCRGTSILGPQLDSKVTVG